MHKCQTRMMNKTEKIEWIIYNTVALYAYNSLRLKNNLWYVQEV